MVNIENRKINFGLALKQIKGNKVVHSLIQSIKTLATKKKLKFKSKEPSESVADFFNKRN